MTNLQDSTRQLLSDWAGFCGRYDKNHFGVFFSVHSVLTYLLTYRTTSGLQCSSVETSRGQEWSTNRGDSSAKCPVHQMSCSASCPMSNLRVCLFTGCLVTCLQIITVIFIVVILFVQNSTRNMYNMFLTRIHTNS